MFVNANDVPTYIGLIGAGIAFFAGLYQYRIGQQWKRLEFLVNEIKEFDNDPCVALAKQILDWNIREINVSIAGKQQLVTVSDPHIEQALLRIPEQRKQNYTDLEVAIRDILDIFFDRLDRFEAYIDSGLFTYESFHPYLSYWLEIITNQQSGKKPPNVQVALRNHVEWYFPGSRSLLHRYERHKK